MRNRVSPIALALLCGLPAGAWAQCQGWGTTIGSPGAQLGDPFVGTVVRSLELLDRGSGPSLFAAGSFQKMGGHTVNHVARWDGAQWHALGAGLAMSSSGGPGPVVFDLQSFDDGQGAGPALYAGGWFDQAGGQAADGIARWNGSAWQSLSPYTNGSVFKMAVHDDGGGPRLYLGGNFREINGMAQHTLVRWTGQGWELVPGAPLFEGGSTVWGFGSHILNDRSSIFVGGLALVPSIVVSTVPHGSLIFDHNPVTGWGYPGYGLEGMQAGGVTAAATAFEVFDDGTGPSLYGGGLFVKSGHTPLANFARFDGQNWVDVAGGVTNPANPHGTLEDGPTVWDLTQHDGVLYLGGGFTMAGSARALWLAAWDGQAYSEPGGGTNNSVYDLQMFDDGSGPAMYVAGSFTRVDPTGSNVAAGGIAKLSCAAACYPDCNGDSSLNLADFGCFQTKFATGASYADCNGDGVRNLADFGCFQTRFAVGCR